jgi:hypothetical protein
MALAPYFSRIADSLAGATSITADQLNEVLDRTSIAVVLGPRATTDPGLLAGVDLLVNLLARLYPRLEIVAASSSGEQMPSAANQPTPADHVARLARDARRINPLINVEVRTRPSPQATVVAFAIDDPDPAYKIPAGTDSRAAVSATATGWAAQVGPRTGDPGARAAEQPEQPAAPLAGLTVACLAAARLFRLVFADYMTSPVSPPDHDETITWQLTADLPVDALAGHQLPPMFLAGAGAIGQSFIAALTAAGAVGDITVVDPEKVELSNVQRYVLTDPGHVARRKVDVAGDHLRQHGWTVSVVETAWGADDRTRPGRDIVVTALDSAEDRIGVAAGVHGAVYNAWTQPADLGWSRHERFGVDACLACLYYPDRPMPSLDELIAEALGQHRLRILSHLTYGVPAGAPLPAVVEVADIAAPQDSPTWTQVPLLADLITSGFVHPDEAAGWARRSITDLYVDGVCAGGLLRPPGAARPSSDVTVPLAHQSALAGVMLALEVLQASHPRLRAARDGAIEHRFNVLADSQQQLARPRLPTSGCLCTDPDYAAMATTDPRSASGS